MEEAMAARFWCHMCSQMVNPIMEVDIKCPLCQSGFIEEMSNTTTRDNREADAEFGSDRALSLWAPILLGMMGNPRRPRRSRLLGLEEDNGESQGEESELDREIDSIIRRRRRSSATILQLLQGIQAGMAAESENYDRDREREGVVVINPLSQTIIVQGSSHDSNQSHHHPIGSLGDYFIGPGLDLLLQHLADNDPNRYGTPPAQKEAVEAMPTVKIEENSQCSVCLDDFELGTEAKEMPCKHKFHPGCILPWLELHSSCPVCRHQLPADESKDGAAVHNGNRSENESTPNPSSGEEGGVESNGRRFSFPWPFTGLFSTPGNSSATSTSPSPGNSTQRNSSSSTDDN